MTAVSAAGVGVAIRGKFQVDVFYTKLSLSFVFCVSAIVLSSSRVWDLLEEA